MPRKHIGDTPTTNPYVWDDVTSYVLREDGTGFEHEDESGYIMRESWVGTLGGGLAPVDLSRDVIKVKSKIRST